MKNDTSQVETSNPYEQLQILQREESNIKLIGSFHGKGLATHKRKLRTIKGEIKVLAKKVQCELELNC